MKIFIYSDLHISRTSSIMPMLSDSLYTYRQQMILNTADYLVDIIKKEQPDLILNLGDTFDQHTLTSYDIEIAGQFFGKFNDLNIPHFVLIGNHEMINHDFNAVAMLDNVQNITIIKDPMSLSFKDSSLAFLPYCDYNDILKFPEGDLLFSHNDIQGSSIRGNFTLPAGISPDILKTKYKLVFNGHIHKPSIMGNIINVGSISTHSFSDDEESVPQCYIFDTESFNLKTYKSTICPLFRKFEIKKDISELEGFINSLDHNYKYILHIISPFEIKDQVKEYLNNNEYVLNNRLNIRVDKEKEINTAEEVINLQPNIDVKQSFKDFLDTVTELKATKDIYNNVLEEV